MKRLVIVGNGFDLACGLKTSYADFQFDYLKSCLEKSLNSKSKKHDDLLVIVKYNIISKFDDSRKIVEDLEDFNDLYNCPYIQMNLTGRNVDCKGFNSNIIPFSITFRPSFYQNTFYNNNWSGLESSYFFELLKIYESTNDIKNPDYLSNLDSKLKTINDQFKFLKEKLIKYISKIDLEVNPNIHDSKSLPSIFQKINTPLLPEDYKGIEISDLEKRNFALMKTNQIEIKDTLYVNFNYTSLLEHQIKSYTADYIPYKIINIHGRANSEIQKDNHQKESNNKIIFGYGDDSHEYYKRIEQTGFDDYLINNKSFYYPSNDSYSILSDFIQSDDFEVFVLGHSLGMSDRVLLKTIFENDRCKKIRLFHRDSEDSHFKSRLAISRHFDNKASMRKKIRVFNSKDILNSDPKLD